MTRTCAVVALDVISLSDEWANRSSWRFSRRRRRGPPLDVGTSP
ncbi:MAG: hypothetical protein ACLQRH_06865 [Acidimicrobiales bacterium]